MRSRSIAWSGIAAIDSKTSWADEDWTEHVRIKPYSGRPFSLPEPMNSSSRPVRNPHFDDDVATIRDYWRRGKAASDQH